MATEREARKETSPEFKASVKADKEAAQLRYGFALVDGHIEKMGNFTVEPPGLFRGRGLHPKMGTLKTRVYPEDVTLNMGTSAVVPACPMPGHAWKRIIHDPTVTWLAMWRENISNGTKYVFLAASSSFKGKSDLKKYEKARKLKKCIGKIREHYEGLLESPDSFLRQTGTAMWVIDRLALRVGGEKDEDEADTVGCCSLRAEHIKFPAGEGLLLELDFLGKDSMRHHQVVQLDRYGLVGKIVHANFKAFVKGKRSDEDVFSALTPDRLNEQLKELMPGLSAKVFRTYNASVTLESELEELPVETKESDKKSEYDRANREVAILCNHQRTVPKAFTENYSKLEERLSLMNKQLEELRAMARGGAIKLKSEDAKRGEKIKAELSADAKKTLAKVRASEGAVTSSSGACAFFCSHFSLTRHSPMHPFLAQRKKDGKTETEPTEDERQMHVAEVESHLFTIKPEKDALTKRAKQWEVR